MTDYVLHTKRRHTTATDKAWITTVLRGLLGTEQRNILNYSENVSMDELRQGSRSGRQVETCVCENNAPPVLRVRSGT